MSKDRPGAPATSGQSPGTQADPRGPGAAPVKRAFSSRTRAVAAELASHLVLLVLGVLLFLAGLTLLWAEAI